MFSGTIRQMKSLPGSTERLMDELEQRLVDPGCDDDRDAAKLADEGHRLKLAFRMGQLSVLDDLRHVRKKQGA